jgi:beta-phosphoglucomutase
MRPRALVFDFNGTLSDDEPILFGIFRELFAEHGRPLTERDYYDRLAGLSDPEIVRTWLGDGHPAIADVIQERTARYRELVADGSSVGSDTRAAVHYAAERVPVALVSGAARAEIDPVLEAAGLASCFTVVVSSDDIGRGKPDPEGYERALALFEGDLRPPDVVVLEDTEAGVAAAKAAGMLCIAVLGTLAPERLHEADEIVPKIDLRLVQQLLG